MLLIKIILGIVIVCITGHIGIEMSNMLKAREEILTEYITFVTLVKNEMIYMRDTLPHAFEICRQKLKTNLKDVIGAIVVDMEKYGVEKVDISIESNVNNLDVLEEEERQIISSTLKNLGRSDVDSQINIINNSIEVVKRQIKEAIDKKNKNTKVYKTVGIITGLIVVVIFI